MTAFLQHTLAVAGSGKGVEVFFSIIAGLITPAIILCIIVGIACCIRAFWDLHVEESGFYNGIFEKCKNVKPITQEKLRSLIQDFPKSANKNQESVSYKRMTIIHDMIEARGRDHHVQAPQMRDLHQLSEQAILSKWAPTGLRVITSVLLIFGVCGTLWGIHSAIPQGGGNFTLKGFAAALNPSRFAVMSTIVFLLARGVYAAMLDNFLRHLDRETMTSFFPLIPESDTDRETARFAESVARFHENLQNAMKPAEQTAAETVEECKDIAQSIKDLAETQSLLEQEVETLAGMHTSLQEPDTTTGTAPEPPQKTIPHQLKK